MVFCVKLRRELPGLEKPPVAGELGQRIYDNISQRAWEMWQEHSRLLINHYGLNLADPDSREILRREMIRFLFGDENDKPEGWTPEDDDGGGSPAAPDKGKGGGGPAPRKK
jgi:Fe-S cluster biosynthesis and repair protein YggX